jgi:tetratricopeptide (TPR) repeat protein
MEPKFDSFLSQEAVARGAISHHARTLFIGEPTMKVEMKRTVTPAHTNYGILEPTGERAIQRVGLLLVLVAFLALLSPGRVRANQADNSLWGDVKIDESEATTPAPLSVTILLYNESGRMVGRQNVSSRGRYRFNNLEIGNYEIAVEAEEVEIARIRIYLPGSSDIGFRQDFDFKWKSRDAAPKSINGVMSAADAYNRTAANKSLFKKAQEAAEKKKYDQAVTLLRQIITSDKLDFQAWTIMGTVYLVQEKVEDAEKAYLGALEAKSTYVPALVHLGKLRGTQKRFEEAIVPLTRAVELQPQSGEANLLLGEAYLQIRKGSKAIPYLEEAARQGRPEAHLRLAWLYNAAGMREKAAVEYEEFLKKNPGYADRKKLEKYISANKKS